MKQYKEKYYWDEDNWCLVNLNTNKPLKRWKDKGGYYCYSICINGKKTNEKEHRIVATLFLPNPNNFSDIDHINTIRTDNRIDNLRWCNRRDNCNNPLSIKHYSETAHSKGKFGKDNNQSKKILQLDKDGNVINEWCGISETARILGYSQGTISNCLTGRRDFAYGYKWRYKE